MLELPYLQIPLCYTIHQVHTEYTEYILHSRVYRYNCAIKAHTVVSADGILRSMP